MPLVRPLAVSRGHEGRQLEDVFILRARNPERQRSGSLAASRQVDLSDHAWDKRIGSREPWRPCGLSPCIEKGRLMQGIHAVCCGIDVHAAQRTACLRQVREDGQSTTA